MCVVEFFVLVSELLEDLTSGLFFASVKHWWDLCVWLFSSRGVIGSTIDWQLTGGPWLKMSNTLLEVDRHVNAAQRQKVFDGRLSCCVFSPCGSDSPSRVVLISPSTLPSFSGPSHFCHSMLLSKHIKAKVFLICLCFRGSHLLEESRNISPFQCFSCLCCTFGEFTLIWECEGEWHLNDINNATEWLRQDETLWMAV